jgi:hypothetical protein
MRRNHWLPLAGGLLLSGVAFLILWWRETPASPAAMGRAKSADAVNARSVGDLAIAPIGKFHGRSQPSASAVDSPIMKALAALENVSEEDQAELLEKITAGWGEERLSDAVIYLFKSESSDPCADLLKISLLRRWGNLAPVETATWAASLMPGESRNAAIEQVALVWSSSDPSAAWDWAESLASDPSRDAAMLSLVYELSRSDPALALDRADFLADSPARTQFIEHAIGNWAASDPQAALVKVKAMSDPALRNASLARLATSWAESDPNSAATLAAESMEPGPAQNRAVASIVQRWAQQDPAAARQWVDSFPDGPLKQNALQHIAEQAPEPGKED